MLLSSSIGLRLHLTNWPCDSNEANKLGNEPKKRRKKQSRFICLSIYFDQIPARCWRQQRPRPKNSKKIKNKTARNASPSTITKRLIFLFFFFFSFFSFFLIKTNWMNSIAIDWANVCIYKSHHRAIAQRTKRLDRERANRIVKAI